MARLSLRDIGLASLFILGSAWVVEGTSLQLSIGIRENNVPGPVFGNGGSSGGGIEWVNRDGQTLIADGTWQLFTFTPATDPLTAFAGTTANGQLEAGHEWAVLEHIRILNHVGITDPIRLWIDDVTNTVASGPIVQDFEAAALGTEVMFQEPGFSGSTTANVLPGSTTAVSDSTAYSGSKSLQFDLQFVDDSAARWVRVTTFDTANQPNPLVRILEPGAPAPTISFYAKAMVIPEPSSLLLACGLSLVAVRCRPRRTRK
ncbi:MAG TPA: hypothetical protein PL151_02275 [Phycisphaerae bacterium]|nr:hypothetical protein [Phycisphaerae bacterium]HOJ75942.1 hypothetical protein [Phycisphaerae bacterium]HOM53383.1 hypothetical protein [Phycisphaerae bacterium]HON66116.1 hypothetical protein [Phycisphaerae bacterium]HOQ84469.1 hypothetical protein [Phycisphaerae bacterium]